MRREVETRRKGEKQQKQGEKRRYGVRAEEWGYENILSEFANLIANTSRVGASSAKSAGTVHTHERSLPAFSCNLNEGLTVRASSQQSRNPSNVQMCMTYCSGLRKLSMSFLFSSTV